MKKFVAALLVSVFVTGCASQVPLKKQTASGKPEGFYQNTDKEKVKDALVNFCNNKGLMIFGADNSTVICGKQQEGGNAILTQALIGNSYSTPPVVKVRFSISQINNDVKVWADMWVETQMAMGQMQQMQDNSNESRNVIQQRLDELKV